MLRTPIFVSALVVLAFASFAHAAQDPASDAARRPLKIHVLTVGQGEELFARFGHITMVVEDPNAATRKVYSFGTFDFSDPALQLKYARGFLVYWLSVGSYMGSLRYYAETDRETVLRTLHLTPEQAQRVARKLEVNALAANREYMYRHYLDNCCTRIRDIIDAITGGVLSTTNKHGTTGRTYRDWTRHALRGQWVMGALILFSLGPKVDMPLSRWQEEFLPEVLSADLDAAKLPSGQPLVGDARIVVQRRGPDVGTRVETVDYVVTFALLGVLVLGLLAPLALGNRKLARRLLGLGLSVFGLLAGLGGLVLVLFLTITTHYDTWGNENLFAYPLSHLWLIGPGCALLFKGRLGPRTGRLVGQYLVLALAVCVLYGVGKAFFFVQDNGGFLAFAVACDAAALACLRRSGAASFKRPPVDA